MNLPIRGEPAGRLVKLEASRRDVLNLAIVSSHAGSVQDLHPMKLKGHKPAPRVPRPTPSPVLSFKTHSRLCPSQAVDHHVGSLKEFSTPALPVDLFLKLAQYNPSAMTADAGHIACGMTDADAFSSFLEVDIPKGETHH